MKTCSLETDNFNILFMFCEVKVREH